MLTELAPRRQKVRGFRSPKPGHERKQLADLCLRRGRVILSVIRHAPRPGVKQARGLALSLIALATVAGTADAACTNNAPANGETVTCSGANTTGVIAPATTPTRSTAISRRRAAAARVSASAMAIRSPLVLPAASSRGPATHPMQSADSARAM